MKLAIILGTRPEIIKMSPVIRECQRLNLNFFIVHTNQHYSKNLDQIFFKELKLPQPKYNLKVGSRNHGEQTGKMLIKIEKTLLKERPDMVLVEGDTNTVLAGGLAASKVYIKVGHIEAGLRSYFRGMPEEINRVLTDHCSDFLFAPTSKAKENLLREGIAKEKIFVTGNTIVDAIYQNIRLAKEKSKILKKLGIQKEKYFLLTAHRQENVDKKSRLAGIFRGIELIYKKYNFPIIYPIHPRTDKMRKNFHLDMPKGLKLIQPLGYLDFLQLEANAKLIFTDSGGIQEESCILHVPCITLRDNTERPETLDVGSNILAGTTPRKILNAVNKMFYQKRDWKNPFGDGESGYRVVAIIKNLLNK